MLIIPAIIIAASFLVEDIQEEHDYRQFQQHVKEHCRDTGKEFLLCDNGAFVVERE